MHHRQTATGDIADFFYQKTADYNIPLNLATLTLEKSLYSNENRVTVILRPLSCFSEFMLSSSYYSTDTRCC